MRVPFRSLIASLRHIRIVPASRTCACLAAAVFAGAAACSHMPGYQGPAYDFRKSALPAETGRKSEGPLPSRDSETHFAYRIDLASKGALIASAKPANPGARLRI